MTRILILMLACAGALAACSGETAVSADRTRNTLAAQAEAWDKAIIAHDQAAIEANMAADFRQIRKGGAVVARAQFLADISDPKLVIAPYKVEDFEIRLYGDTALLSGRIAMDGSYDGQAFRSHFRYIDIYVREQGRWKVSSVQITPMAP
jgi:ketosteroid isomerase-like protein